MPAHPESSSTQPPDSSPGAESAGARSESGPSSGEQPRESRRASAAVFPQLVEDHLKAGDIVGGCEIMERIGVGGMGAVYRAKQLALEKIVALKVMSPNRAKSKEFVANFMREARLAARLEHENIVQVFDADTQDDIPYIVMQIVEGQTLRERLREVGLLPVPELMDAARQAATGLAWAHQKRVIHRDVKPENLMRTPTGLIKVADFGLAREDEELVDERQDRRIMASAGYMSPEHADLQPVDARSDCYSLGITLYMLACGKRPFYGDSHLELVLKHHLEQPMLLSALRREIPLQIAAMVDKLIAKRPEDRYPNADEFIADLKLIAKRNLPKIAYDFEGQNVEPTKLLPLSISRAGVKRCLEIQKAMKQRGDPILSLGQLMRSNGYVDLEQPRSIRAAADLPFLLAKDEPDLDAALLQGPADRDAPWISLTRFREQCESTPAGTAAPTMRAVFAPVTVAYDDDCRLTLALTRTFESELEVQHFFDILAAFPFVDIPRVTLTISSDAGITVDDVPWMVDSHNLLKRRSGHLEIRCLDAESLAFFTSHRLQPYLDIAMLGEQSGSGPLSDEVLTLPAAHQTGHSTATPIGVPAPDGNGRAAPQAQGATAGAPVKPHPAPLPIAVAPVTPLDEAKSLLAAGDALRAKQALQPLLAGTAGKAPDAKALAREIAESCVALGEESFGDELFEGAKQWFDHAIDICPEFAAAFYHKGLTLKKLGHLDYALRYLNQAVELEPEHAEYVYNRAIVLSRRGEMDAAIRDLTRATELNPRHANAFYNRGVAHERNGDLRKAITDYRLAVKLNPKFNKSLGQRIKSLQAKDKSLAGVEEAEP